MRWGDLVIDLDEIYHAISFLPYYEKPDCLLQAVFRVRDALVEELRSSRRIAGGWVITSGSKLADREKLRRHLKAQVIVVETSYNQCLFHISKDERRRAQLDQWQGLVKKWWDTYEPSEDDKIVRVG
jgi:hypothetical protein